MDHRLSGSRPGEDRLFRAKIETIHENIQCEWIRRALVKILLATNLSKTDEDTYKSSAFRYRNALLHDRVGICVINNIFISFALAINE
jgi:hypothetical protein